ncbi:MAG: LacI family DNA-binding transcriptional regulator [Terracidiphilus sp.]
MEGSATDKRQKKNANPAIHPRASLKQLAEYLGLNPATVSVVLNDVPGRSIPEATRDRIKAAARQMNYQPNLLARCATGAP